MGTPAVSCTRTLGWLGALVVMASLHMPHPVNAAGRRWGAEFHLGGAWNLPMSMVVRQQGHDDLKFRSHWQTRATEVPLYYVVRVIRSNGARGWALDLTHHKLFLDDPPVEIQAFAISHGYNLVTVHRLFERGARRLGVGAGLVVAHPEGEIRGQALDEHGGPWGGGYHLTGPTASALAGWLPARRSGFHATAEARLTGAYASVPIPGGQARVPNLALHLTLGIAWGAAP